MERNHSSYVIFSVIIGGVLILGATVLGNQSHFFTSTPEVEQSSTPAWTGPERQVLRERTLLSADESTRTQDWFLDLVEVVPNTFNLTAGNNGSLTETTEPPNENRFTRRLAQEVRASQAAAASGDTSAPDQDEVLMAFARELVPKNFTLREINVQRSTPERNIAYLNAAGEILLNSEILAQTTSEQQLFHRATRRNVTENFATLAELSQNYRNIRDELLQLQVPTKQAEKHLLLINGSHRMATALHFMSEYQKDSFLATLYNDSITNHIELLNTTYALYGEETYRNRDSIDAFDGSAVFAAIYDGIVNNNN